MMAWVEGLAGAALVMGWQAFWKRVYETKTDARAVHYAETQDGWRIALSHYPAQGPSRNHPVLLCHGLSANRFSFDIDAETSMARYLFERGFDVWVMELRGHGLSDHPGLFRKHSYGWAFEHYLLQDAPAAIDYIREVTGAPQVHWLGHSMGGILLYAQMAQGSTSIRSGITVGSGLDYSVSESRFRFLRPLAGMTRLIRFVPFGGPIRFLSPFSGWFNNPIEEFNMWLPNVRGERVRRVCAQTFHPISAPVLGQLASAMEPGGLRSLDGSVQYLEDLSNATTPVMALAGSCDRQCPPKAVEVPFEVLQGPKEFCILGREHGQQEEYGHFDLLVGDRVTTEVFPRILRWFERFDELSS